MRDNEDRVGQKEASEGPPELHSGIRSHKPWEETWERIPGERVIGPVGAKGRLLATPNWRVVVGSEQQRTDCARLDLAACAPEMARMLYEREWHDGRCLSCGAWAGDDHADDCAWLLLMRRAGIR